MDKKKLMWIGIYAVAAYFIYSYFKKQQPASATPATPAKPVTPVSPAVNAANKDIVQAMSEDEKTEFTNQLISQYLNAGKTFTDGMILKTKFGDWTKKNGILVKA
jgi:hypothetical protein